MSFAHLKTNNSKTMKKFIDNFKYVWKYCPKLGCYFENPFSIIYNKTIRRLFATPKLKFSVKYVTGNDKTEYNALFGLYLCNIYYKNKYGKWYMEGEPFIQLNLLGACFILEFLNPIDSVTDYSYWESILSVYCDYIWRGKHDFNLYNIIKANTFGRWRANNEEYEVENTTDILINQGIQRYYADKACALQDNK